MQQFLVWAFAAWLVFTLAVIVVLVVQKIVRRFRPVNKGAATPAANPAPATTAPTNAAAPTNPAPATTAPTNPAMATPADPGPAVPDTAVPAGTAAAETSVSGAEPASPPAPAHVDLTTSDTTDLDLTQDERAAPTSPPTMAADGAAPVESDPSGEPRPESPSRARSQPSIRVLLEGAQFPPTLEPTSSPDGGVMTLEMRGTPETVAPELANELERLGYVLTPVGNTGLRAERGVDLLLVEVTITGETSGLVTLAAGPSSGVVRTS